MLVCYLYMIYYYHLYIFIFHIYPMQCYFLSFQMVWRNKRGVSQFRALCYYGFASVVLFILSIVLLSVLLNVVVEYNRAKVHYATNMICRSLALVNTIRQCHLLTIIFITDSHVLKYISKIAIT